MVAGFLDIIKDIFVGLLAGLFLFLEFVGDASFEVLQHFWSFAYALLLLLHELIEEVGIFFKDFIDIFLDFALLDLYFLFTNDHLIHESWYIIL